jgi:hypothetical protein
LFAAAPAAGAVFRLEVGPIAEFHQGAQSLIGHQDHIAAFAPIPAIGTPGRDILLPAKANHPIAAIAGFHPDYRLIDKHDSTSMSWQKTPLVYSQRRFQQQKPNWG